MLTAIVIVFIIGYLAIAFEHSIHINKAASALLMGVLCWTIYVIDVQSLLPMDMIPEWFVHEASEQKVHDIQQHFLVEGQLLHLTGEIAGILFFLMGAMTIVELVDAHEGFSVITNRIKPKSKRSLMWSIAWLSFFFSAVLDNLTTTIVMISLVRKLVSSREDRLMMAGLIVIAANAGGAWTVIGDVTTTMLWIKQKIGTVEVMIALLLPSLTCLLVPLFLMSRRLIGPVDLMPAKEFSPDHPIKPWHQWLFLILGLGGLLFVPLFKMWTHLPPFQGMLLSLSIVWIASEFVGFSFDEDVRSSTGVLAALKRVDMSAILFFLGILLAVGALGNVGALRSASDWLNTVIPNQVVVAVITGLISAVVDNVPLVAAGIEMYDEPPNDPFWMLLAYCAGTGGSCLIIGSAAGVAAMGLEQINFMWYFRKIAPWAMLGYFSGIVVYLIQRAALGVFM
jgi:Na+/H+ antiporter NhaD/arsenite permease-like protein